MSTHHKKILIGYSGGWTRVANNVTQSFNSPVTNISYISYSSTIRGNTSMIKSINNGAATYSGIYWTWTGVFPQRICVNNNSTWKYLSTNGVPQSNNTCGSSTYFYVYGCEGSFTSFVPTYYGTSNNSTCKGNSNNLSPNYCNNYAVINSDIRTTSQIGDCEVVMNSGSSDNSGSLFYDFYIK